MVKSKKHFELNFIIVLAVIIQYSCKQNNNSDTLPILGNPTFVKHSINGTITIDSIFPIIRNFSFVNQDSSTVTNQTFKDKIYVADFIFLSCATICPKMNQSMLDVYKAYEKNPNILFLSHSIDTENDTIPRLKEYSNALNVSSKKWHFVTGNQDSIYNMANENYFATAYKDVEAEGGYTHSGGLLLIDKNKHIRGVYDGTDPHETERLIKDIEILLKEQF